MPQHQQCTLSILDIYFSKNISNNANLSLSKCINCNVKEKCYDTNYVVPFYLRTISRNYFSSLKPLHVSIEEHENIMDEDN